MKYLNIFVFIIILILLFIFPVNKKLNKTKVKKEKKYKVLKYRSSISQTEEDNNRKLIIPIFNEEKSTKSEQENQNISKNISQKNNIKFKTTNEIFKNFFPDLKKEFGKDIKFFLLRNHITMFLIGLRDNPLTQQQKELRRKLMKERSLKFREVTPDYSLSVEEEIELEEKLNIIREEYITKVVNILTKEQQNEVIIIYEETVLDKLRERKELGEKLSLNRIKILKEKLEQKNK